MGALQEKLVSIYFQRACFLNKLNIVEGYINKYPEDLNKGVLYVLSYSLWPGQYTITLDVTEEYNSYCSSPTITVNDYFKYKIQINKLIY